jgi:Family of unknown function (DUF5317)
MILFLGVFAGVFVGLLGGGKLDRIADLRLRGAWLFIAALALQVVAFPSGYLPFTISDGVATGLWLCSYALLVALAFLNLRVRGFPLATAGMLSNLVAVLANGGHMPALPRALVAAGTPIGHLHNNSVVADHPHLSWLIDRWGAPEWVPLANVYSVGDVLLALGTIVIVSAAMGAGLRRPLSRRARSAAV